jgi:hypothetical protein
MFRVWGLGFEVQGNVFKILGLINRVQGSGIRRQG